MDFNKIFQRALAIITKPVDEWKKIKGESATVADLFTNYAIILAAIPAIAGFLGYMMIGRSFMGMTIRLPFGNSIVWAIMMYIFSLIGVFVLAFVIDTLAPNFGSKKDMVASTKVAVYSTTPSWVGGIFHIIPALAILAMIAGFYSLYLLFLGIKDIKEPQGDKATPYFIVVIVTYIIVAFLISFIVGSIAFGRAGGFM
ncbi:MAG: Yip1 family protein [Acidobacteriota bacterium]